MMRLDKFLSEMGIASRKELKEIIRSGRVTVDEKTASVPDLKIDPGQSDVWMDGKKLEYKKFRYFVMDKPSGVLTASEDRKQKTVIDLLPEELKKIGLFPVGRLDKDTTGLLLLTNDGEYAHQVISPKYEIMKCYLAEIDGDITEDDVIAFKNGLILRDGLHCLPANLEKTGKNLCRVTVMEGKYHQVKRMLASVGKPVISLRRISIGALTLEQLPEGENLCEISQEISKIVFLQNSQK